MKVTFNIVGSSERENMGDITSNCYISAMSIQEYECATVDSAGRLRAEQR